MSEKKSHWEKVYTTKAAHEVSWTQKVPETSLGLINNLQLDKSASIIDVGGGDSLLVDFLLAQGYQNITVLDISEAALERAKKRLGDQAGLVKWLVSDITDFAPAESYDVWHDRATFHFLTTAAQIEKYIAIAKGCVRGYLTIGTFSKNGPEKCSGLEIKQYSEEQLEQQFSESFQKLQGITEDHMTPFNTVQNFIFCSFKRI